MKEVIQHLRLETITSQRCSLPQHVRFKHAADPRLRRRRRLDTNFLTCPIDLYDVSVGDKAAWLLHRTSAVPLAKGNSAIIHLFILVSYYMHYDFSTLQVHPSAVSSLFFYLFLFQSISLLASHMLRPYLVFLLVIFS